jgi:hypothetical protein
MPTFNTVVLLFVYTNFQSFLIISRKDLYGCTNYTDSQSMYIVYDETEKP